MDGKPWPHGNDFGASPVLEIINEKGKQEWQEHPFWGHWDMLADDLWRCYLLKEDEQRGDFYGEGPTARAAWDSLIRKYVIMAGDVPAIQHCRHEWAATLDELGVV